MATIVGNDISDGVATSAEHSWVEISGDSVFDGASVMIEASSTDVEAKYVLSNKDGTFDKPGWLFMVFPVGTFIRIRVFKAGPRTRINYNLL